MLVIGAGGVSPFSAQPALAAGATVVAAVRHGQDDPRWAQIGVDHVVLTTEAGWGAALKQRTGGTAEVVNSVGGSMVAERLACLRSGGEIAVPGLYDTGPATVDVLSTIGVQTSLRGVAVGSVTMHRDLAALVQEHGIHPVVQRRVAFDALPQAYAVTSGESVFGKTVVELA